MEAVLATGGVDAVAVADPSPECVEAALKLAPGAGPCRISTRCSPSTSTAW
jgi:hypothetical protein